MQFTYSHTAAQPQVSSFAQLLIAAVGNQVSRLADAVIESVWAVTQASVQVREIEHNGQPLWVVSDGRSGETFEFTSEEDVLRWLRA